MSEKNEVSFLLSVRFLMAISLFLGFCLNYMQKIDMSIAIVCMINQTALNLQSKQQHLTTNSVMNFTSTTHSMISSTAMAMINTTRSASDKCILAQSSSGSKHHDGPFAWPKSIQGIILSSYFYGYIFTQIPGGWMSFRFGAQKVLTFSMGIGSLITILIPVCAKIHYIALMICLFFTGVAHGSFWPSVSSFWAYWAPDKERSRLVGLASSGAKVGNIVALSLGSILCIHGFDGGWPSIFYLFGTAGVCWAVIFFFISSDSPAVHRFIGNNEKEYIMKETEKARKLRVYCQKFVPWKQIVTSKACWSIFIGHFAHNWGNYLFLTQIPSFLKDVLKFDIKSNGFVSSIPYIASWVAINLSSLAIDKVMTHTSISRTNARRLFSFAGLILPAIAIVILSFIDCTHVVWGVIVLTIGVATDSIMMGAGYLVNINDIAGPYAGIVFGLSNTLATLPGIISPTMASALTKNGLQSEWQKVFIISAIIYLVGGIVDVILLDATIQPWAKINTNDSNDDTGGSGMGEIIDQNNSKSEPSGDEIKKQNEMGKTNPLMSEPVVHFVPNANRTRQISHVSHLDGKNTEDNYYVHL